MPTRRPLLLLLLLLLCAAGASRAHAQAAAAQGGTRYVIVHGAWGGGWAWRQVDSLLTARGHSVHRVTLTGLGERVHLATPDIDLATHVQDVVNTLLFEELTDVVLIGHSYGGMVITGAADRVPERIRRLVYLDAFLPEDGESVQALTGGRGPGAQATNGFLVPAWRRPDAPPPGDVPHPAKTFSQPLSLKNPRARQIPGTYILTIDAPGREDATFSPSAARARARGFTVQEMVADHNPQWSKVPELVERLAAIR